MHHTTHDPFIEQLTGITGQDPSQCYQCGKCSAGCPVREFAVDPPNRVVRFVQLGLYERALTSKTPWLCAGCHTCSSRCPKEFDLAKFMDAVREISISYGIEPADKDAAKFHEAFMHQIKNYGKSFELGLMLEYKLKSMHLMNDADLAPGMLLRGKLAMTPHLSSERKTIKKIMDNASTPEHKADGERKGE
jgi:heterodisulfide reductase subunit C